MAKTKIQTALITGASGGIGAELARLFAADGTNLLLVARSEDKLSALKEELEGRWKVAVTLLTADLSQPGAAQAIYAFTQEKGIRPDALVCNAGLGDWGFFTHRPLDKLTAMLHLNVLALTELARLFLPAMEEAGQGRILNVASIASFMPGPKMAVYYASKAYVRSLSEALSVELKGSGVTVTALCPGPVKTDFWTRAEADESGIFSRLLFADSRKVAESGYRALLKGKVLALPGFSTACFAFLSSILPRALVRNMVYQLQK